jgi:hypothetical protein
MLLQLCRSNAGLAAYAYVSFFCCLVQPADNLQVVLLIICYPFCCRFVCSFVLGLLLTFLFLVDFASCPIDVATPSIPCRCKKSFFGNFHGMSSLRIAGEA